MIFTNILTIVIGIGAMVLTGSGWPGVFALVILAINNPVKR